jgi:hypothetical protein
MAGIYILKTLDGYRAGYVKNLAKVYQEFNPETLYFSLEPTIIRDCFGNSVSFDNIQEAMDYAVSVVYPKHRNENLDDGIGFVIKDAQYKSFFEII